MKLQSTRAVRWAEGLTRGMREGLAFSPGDGILKDVQCQPNKFTPKADAGAHTRRRSSLLPSPREKCITLQRAVGGGLSQLCRDRRASPGSPMDAEKAVGEAQMGWEASPGPPCRADTQGSARGGVDIFPLLCWKSKGNTNLG